MKGDGIGSAEREIDGFELKPNWSVSLPPSLCKIRHTHLDIAFMPLFTDMRTNEKGESAVDFVTATSPGDGSITAWMTYPLGVGEGVWVIAGHTWRESIDCRLRRSSSHCRGGEGIA